MLLGLPPSGTDEFPDVAPGYRPMCLLGSVICFSKEVSPRRSANVFRDFWKGPEIAQSDSRTRCALKCRQVHVLSGGSLDSYIHEADDRGLVCTFSSLT